MVTLACIDGGLICIPTLLIALGAITAWIKGKADCKAHKCHDHPCIPPYKEHPYNSCVDCGRTFYDPTELYRCFNCDQKNE